MDCPNCGTEMDTKGASGKQNGVRVDVAWDECPDCETVVDDLGNVIRPDEDGVPRGGPR